MMRPPFAADIAERLAAAWRRRAVALKAASFALVGVVNTAIDAAIFFTALGFLTSSLVVANVLAWLVAVSGSYVMNSFITFGPESGRRLRLRDYARFLGSGIAAVTASTTTVVVAANFMPIWLAKAIAIVVSFAINFSINHFYVFRTQGRPAGDVR
jgi:putative flippase GtrA